MCERDRREGGRTALPRLGVRSCRRPSPLRAPSCPLPPQIRVVPSAGRRLEHAGIRVQLIGRIELASERGTKHDFVSLVRELAPPGELTAARVLPFEFKNVDLQYDSYRGIHARCRCGAPAARPLRPPSAALSLSLSPAAACRCAVLSTKPYPSSAPLTLLNPNRPSSYMLRVVVAGKGMTPDTKREAPLWVRRRAPPPCCPLARSPTLSTSPLLTRAVYPALRAGVLPALASPPLFPSAPVLTLPPLLLLRPPRRSATTSRHRRRRRRSAWRWASRTACTSSSSTTVRRTACGTSSSGASTSCWCAC